jgi:hypothetical protein
MKIAHKVFYITASYKPNVFGMIAKKVIKANREDVCG